MTPSPLIGHDVSVFRLTSPCLISVSSVVLVHYHDISNAQGNDLTVPGGCLIRIAISLYWSISIQHSDKRDRCEGQRNAICHVEVPGCCMFSLCPTGDADGSACAKVSLRMFFRLKG